MLLVTFRVGNGWAALSSRPGLCQSQCLLLRNPTLLDRNLCSHERPHVILKGQMCTNMEVAWSSLVTQRNVSTDTALSHITDKRNMKTVSPCSQHTVCACFSHRCWLPVQPKALLRGRLMSCWDLPRDLHAPSSGLSSPSDASGHRQQRKHSLKDTGSGTVL